MLALLPRIRRYLEPLSAGSTGLFLFTEPGHLSKCDRLVGLQQPLGPLRIQPLQTRETAETTTALDAETAGTAENDIKSSFVLTHQRVVRALLFGLNCNDIRPSSTSVMLFNDKKRTSAASRLNCSLREINRTPFLWSLWSLCPKQLPFSAVSASECSCRCR